MTDEYDTRGNDLAQAYTDILLRLSTIVLEAEVVKVYAAIRGYPAPDYTASISWQGHLIGTYVLDIRSTTSYFFTSIKLASTYAGAIAMMQEAIEKERLD